MQTSHNVEQWVHDPFTGKLIDVSPLFSFLQQYNQNPVEISEEIDDTMFFMVQSLSDCSDSKQVLTVIHSQRIMRGLREVFKAMKIKEVQ